MQAESEVVFTQKWMGDAVKTLLQKEEITKGDLEMIKYLRIGSDSCGSYGIEMSLETPPDPFCDADGGDEWEPGGYGAVVTGRFIRLYIDYTKEHPFDSIDSETGVRVFQLSQYDFWKKCKEEYRRSAPEENSEDWEDTKKKWRSFEKTIRCESYREEFDDDNAYEEWEQRTEKGIQQDIGLFTGLEVLRMQGAEYQDMTFLREMPRLRVLEVVESSFLSLEGIDDLARLKQLCCWVD